MSATSPSAATNRLSVWAFGVGIASIFLFWLFVVPVAAAVLGVLGMKQSRKRGERGYWMAVTGLVLGVLYTIVGIWQWTR